MPKLYIVVSKPKKALFLTSQGHLYGVIEAVNGDQIKFHTKGNKKARKISQGVTAVAAFAMASMIFGVETFTAIGVNCILGYISAATTSPHFGRWQMVKNFNLQKAEHDYVCFDLSSEQEKKLLSALNEKEGRVVLRTIVGLNCVTNLSSVLKNADVNVSRPYTKTPRRALNSLKRPLAP